MARHNEILEQFKACVDDFDFRNVEHINTVCIIDTACLFAAVNAVTNSASLRRVRSGAATPRYARNTLRLA